MAEHPAVNRRVVGSNPTRGAFESPAAAGLSSSWGLHRRPARRTAARHPTRAGDLSFADADPRSDARRAALDDALGEAPPRPDASRPARAARGVRAARDAGADLDELADVALRDRHGRRHPRRHRRALPHGLEHVRRRAARRTSRARTRRPIATPPRAISRRTCTRCRRSSSRASPAARRAPARADLAALYGSIIQAGWSFQLAARARGLGSAWTTYHLDYEARGRRAGRHPVRRGHAGRADPGRVHDRHRLQAGPAQPARVGAALGAVVSRLHLRRRAR